MPARDVDDDRICLGGVARPVHLRPRRLCRALELHEVLIEAGEDVGLDAAAGFAQFLPVGQLGDDAGALRANRLRRVVQIRPKLPVRELDPRRGREVSHAASVDARISARCIVRTLLP